MISGSRRTGALALAVALVLADSSVVVLALPDMLAEYDTSVETVAWVLTGFNLVLALAAVPAAVLAARVGAATACAGGLLVFAAASATCALAPSVEVLIAARCVQAAGGALAVCAALELLPASAGSEARAVAVWTSAGAAGAAVGPALGGLLTDLVSWQAIFVVQVPAALAPLVGVRRTVDLSHPELERVRRPDVAAAAALAAVSAGLVAALFLLVLLLIEGWGMTPLAAAVAVSVIPLTAVAGLRLARLVPGRAPRAAAGALLLAAGLAALGLLPDASVAWTLVPQAFVGLGLAFTVGTLTETALADRHPQAMHGAWTIAARHAGIVVALVVLTPLFVADLQDEEDAAERAGTALVLDSQLPLERKLTLGVALAERTDAAAGQVPDLDPVFREQRAEGDVGELDRLRAAIDDEVRAAATAAFTRSFLVGGALAAVALVPIAALAARRP